MICTFIWFSWWPTAVENGHFLNMQRWFAFVLKPCLYINSFAWIASFNSFVSPGSHFLFPHRVISVLTTKQEIKLQLLWIAATTSVRRGGHCAMSPSQTLKIKNVWTVFGSGVTKGGARASNLEQTDFVFWSLIYRVLRGLRVSAFAGRVRVVLVRVRGEHGLRNSLCG